MLKVLEVFQNCFLIKELQDVQNKVYYHLIVFKTRKPPCAQEFVFHSIVLVSFFKTAFSFANFSAEFKTKCHSLALLRSSHHRKGQLFIVTLLDDCAGWVALVTRRKLVECCWNSTHYSAILENCGYPLEDKGNWIFWTLSN